MSYPDGLARVLDDLQHVTTAGNRSVGSIETVPAVQFKLEKRAGGAIFVTFAAIGRPVLIGLAEWFARHMTRHDLALPDIVDSLESLGLNRDAMGDALMIEDRANALLAATRSSNEDT
ncbi:MAG: hypothetical protein AAF290_01705 [Pseudomonadota bacterium]